MSPASQGSLEVERYIGSCLISARSHNNSSKNCGPANNHHQQHHGNYKNKKVEGGGGNGGNSGRGVRPPARPLLGCPHHQGYAPPGGQMVPMCECARYGSPRQPHNAPPGGGWAGMPLISMANSARRNRKPTTAGGPPRSHNNNNNNRPSPPPPPPPQCVEGDPNLRTPLSRLAIHTQGAPLILTGHYNARKNNNNNNSNNSNVQRGAPGRQFKGESHQQPRRCNSGDVPREIRGGNNNNNNNNNTPNSDCLSVASDESSGQSENSLPRIIKPRKRRKKDRKPTASPPAGVAATGETEPGSEVSGIVTLKPYVPLCRELYDNHRAASGGRRREDADGRWGAERRAEDSERTTPCSKDVATEGNQRPSSVNNGDAPQNTLFPYPCPPSTCQCRYCDPAGQIWDVDQHCYSPFLTPPSIDLSYPLFLTPPPEVKTFDFFNKDFKDSSSHVTDADHKEVVRRSWSEPSASYVDNDDDADARRSLNDFGVIGGGRTCDGGQVRRDASRHLSTSSEASTSSSSSTPSSSLQSLEVSTEIVTSLNGHRDLEIKFFSSSPPSVMVDVFDFSGCDSADNWRCAKGSHQDLWSGSQLESPVFQVDLNRNHLTGVWGSGDVCVEEVVSDRTWGQTWSAEAAGSDCSSKQLSEEVDQLCLQNFEE